MRPFAVIFVNELRAILRSKTLLLLLGVSVGWMFAAPEIFTGDGTESGMRQLSLYYSLGGVATLLSVTLLISATGSIARERAERRLALTMVRPVRYSVIALGKMFAYVFVGAVVLAISAVIEFSRQDEVRCRHVFRPVMPSVMEEAEAMYAEYMASSNTPMRVRQAKKEDVVRLLANRARERYDSIATNSVWTWKFDTREIGSADSGVLPSPLVRFRFSTDFNQREEVLGSLSLGVYQGVVSNITQAVIEVPLQLTQHRASPDELVFRNRGKSHLMLRPRRDVELLIPADAFGWNLLRAYLVLVSMLTVLVAFGVFLGSALGRPTALFTAIVVLLLSEMTPSVLDQYVDELEVNRADAIGLAITRAAAYVTKPISSLRPLEALSLDECVETREVLRVMAVDMVCIPLLFALLSVLVMPRKQD